MLNPQRLNQDPETRCLVESPVGLFARYHEMEPFIAVTLCSVRFRKAQAWLFHLQNREEPRDEDAIDKAVWDLHEAKHMLDTALALVGDEYAAKRLGLSEKKEGKADAA